MLEDPTGEKANLVYMGEYLETVTSFAAAGYVFAFDSNARRSTQIISGFCVVGNLLWVYMM